MTDEERSYNTDSLPRFYYPDTSETENIKAEAPISDSKNNEQSCSAAAVFCNVNAQSNTQHCNPVCSPCFTCRHFCKNYEPIDGYVPMIPGCQATSAVPQQQKAGFVPSDTSAAPQAMKLAGIAEEAHDTEIKPRRKIKKLPIIIASAALLAVLISVGLFLLLSALNNGEARKPGLYLFDKKEMLAVSDSTGKWGFINKKGEEIIRCKYDEVQGFAKNGLAPVNRNGKWGYIDLKGEVKIDYQYKYANPFNDNGTALVMDSNSRYYLIDANGNQKTEEKYYTILTKPYGSTVLYFASKGTSREFALMNCYGKLLTDFEFSTMADFSLDGYIAVQTKNANSNEHCWGIIDTNGKTVVDIINSSIEQTFFNRTLFENGPIVATINSQIIYYDNKGNEVFDDKHFTYAGRFASNGLAIAQTNDGWHILNKSGELKKIAPGNKFFRVDGFDESGFAVGYEDQYNVKLINSNGDILFDGQNINYPTQVNEQNGSGLKALVFAQDGRIGIVNQSGNIIKEFSRETNVVLRNETITVNNHTVYDLEFNELYTYENYSISPMNEDGTIFLARNSAKSAIINKDKEILFESDRPDMVGTCTEDGYIFCVNYLNSSKTSAFSFRYIVLDQTGNILLELDDYQIKPFENYYGFSYYTSLIPELSGKYYGYIID